MGGYYNYSNRACRCPRCRARGLMGPAVLITIGVLMLLDQLNVADFGSSWPIILIVIGAVRVFQSGVSMQGHMDGSMPAGTPPPPVNPSAPPNEPGGAPQGQVRNG